MNSEQDLQNAPHEKPLQGILVVAVEQAVAAPLCTARLAEAGARVIKIERPGGDFARGYDKAARGDSAYFVWTNQGKQSVVLDFKQDEDKLLLERLIASADVFIQNLAPGAAMRAGFGSQELRARHPKLVTCDISGYGDSEEMAQMKAYDFLVQAESGLVDISGGVHEMGRIGVSVCDIGAGMAAHAAIVEALFLASRTGKGSSLEISLFDVAAEWMSVPLIHNDYGDGPPTRQGLQHPSIAPYGAYQTSDKVKTVISIQNEREWLRFCDIVLGQAAMASDAKFSTNSARVENRAELDQRINAVISLLSADEFKARLFKASIAQGRINTVAGLSEHAALKKMPVINCEGKMLEIPAPPARWSGKEEQAGAPQLGAHTEQIRQEFSRVDKDND